MRAVSLYGASDLSAAYLECWFFFGVVSTWTPKVCRIIAFYGYWAIILPTFGGLGTSTSSLILACQVLDRALHAKPFNCSTVVIWEGRGGGGWTPLPEAQNPKRTGAKNTAQSQERSGGSRSDVTASTRNSHLSLQDSRRIQYVTVGSFGASGVAGSYPGSQDSIPHSYMDLPACSSGK